MLTAIVFLAVGFVAFTNGANANFKGVASLYGSGVTTLRKALWWGTATTFAGSIAAMFLAEELLKKFTGRGIVPDSLIESPAFLCAVAIGAAATSFLATRYGFPVSTTHALVGAPPVTLIIPECPGRPCRVQLSQGVRPALSY